MALSIPIHEASATLTECFLTSKALGTVRICSTDSALVAIELAEHRGAPPRGTRRLGGIHCGRHHVLERALAELGEYLHGTRTSFSLPLAPEGTAFQHAVWDALSAIPFGETRSYAEIAIAVGRPGAARAVGAANARNPLAVVVPCHRVIGGRGDLVGYAGGLERKRWLLAHESRDGRTPPSRWA